MLTISHDLAAAFEAGTFARWRHEIAADLRTRHPTETVGFSGDELLDWVQDAVGRARLAGAVTHPDIAFFVETLFRMTKVGGDPAAARDFAAIMAAPGPWRPRIALLRRAF